MPTRPYLTMPEPDRSQILDLLSAYTRLYDDNRIDEHAGLFVAEAVVVPNFGPGFPEKIEGIESLRQFYAEARKQAADAGIQTRHYSTNPLFSEAGEESAKVSVNMLYAEFSNGATEVKLVGCYYFELVKVSEEWFIQKVSMNYDV